MAEGKKDARAREELKRMKWPQREMVLPFTLALFMIRQANKYTQKDPQWDGDAWHISKTMCQNVNMWADFSLPLLAKKNTESASE